LRNFGDSKSQAPTIAETASTADELVLGQSLPLSGPSAQLGLDYRRGAMAWFDAVNRQDSSEHASSA